MFLYLFSVFLIPDNLYVSPFKQDKLPPHLIAYLWLCRKKLSENICDGTAFDIN